MAFIIIYVTYPNKEIAKNIINLLLKEKLIACANIIPTESFYIWDKKVQNEKEIVSILKTKPSNYTKIKSLIKKNHPYKVPCITKIKASANKSFEKWINESI